jgi:hypothetical protein
MQLNFVASVMQIMNWPKLIMKMGCWLAIFVSICIMKQLSEAYSATIYVHKKLSSFVDDAFAVV